MSLQYQDFLLEEFRSRRSRNPHYSLRAFARDIGMPASKLSQNLRGLCGISVAKAEMISQRLQMREDEKQLFLALVESQHARSRVARQQALVALKQIHLEKLDELTLEKFATIRDWFHMAILEMVEIKGFRADFEWISLKLGLKKELVVEAVERLKNLNLIVINEDSWKQTKKDMELPGGVPSRTVREHHKQILTKAIIALDSTTLEKREYSAQTMAVDSTLIGELKSLVRDFQKKICKLTHKGEKNSVYVLSMQLFPLVELEGVEQ